ncbi:MAG: imidazolonepropionase [Dysgonamonadaceae bacterium]|jgi:imidazolonepropionase|nr:imidazolonepropionase [Dysgonamonadaceae bacterium]
MNSNYIIRNIGCLVTCSGFSAKHGKEMSDLGIIENGKVVITNGIISYVGHSSDTVPVECPEDYEIIDAQGNAVLPGFIDSHTHLVFGGYREEEFSWRMKGDTYLSILNRGGGIYSTVQATRNASFEDLELAAKNRLDKMLAMGVTTVEAKSGYGLDKETELKQLRVLKKLNRDHPIDLVSTYLGAHAVAKEYGDEKAYINFMLQEVMPAVREENLAACCDIFCEEGVFSVPESERFLLEAQAMGFQLKIHADEIVSTGGAELAAGVGALSADHLLHASHRGVEALAKSHTVATLLPCTAFSLKENYARGREMIDAGCAVALATDLNPGSSFTASIPLTIALACIYMQLSPEEAVTALTINAAAAIGKADSIGSIDTGKKGDLIILEYPSYRFLPYHVGMNCVQKTIKSYKL